MKNTTRVDISYWCVYVFNHCMREGTTVTVHSSLVFAPCVGVKLQQSDVIVYEQELKIPPFRLIAVLVWLYINQDEGITSSYITQYPVLRTSRQVQSNTIYSRTLSATL